jgi:protein gp37
VAAGGGVQEAGAREGGSDGRQALGRDVLKREAATGSTRLGGRRRRESGGCFTKATKMTIPHRWQKETSVKIASV